MKYTVDDIKICIYTICKDEEIFANRWLLSAQEADAIFVNDTGSTDRTVEILERHPKVTLIHGKSCGKDFAFDDAWNEVLEIIPDTFDICIRLDLDIMLTCGWCNIIKKKIIKSINNKEINLATHNLDLVVYQEQDPFDKDNLVRKPFYVCYGHSYSDECRYYGAIHEDFSNHSFKNTVYLRIDQRLVRFIHTKKRKNTELDLYSELAKKRFKKSPTYFNYLTWVSCCRKKPEESLSCIFEVLNEISEETNDALTRMNFTLFMEKKERTSRFYIICLAFLYCLFYLKDFEKTEKYYKELVLYRYKNICIKQVDYFYGSIDTLKSATSNLNDFLTSVRNDIFSSIKQGQDNFIYNAIVLFYSKQRDNIKKVLLNE